MSTLANTTPYPWPYHGQLDVGRTALIVTGKGWHMVVDDDVPVRTQIGRLRTCLAAAGVRVYVVAHPVPNRPLRRAASPAPDLAPGDGEIVITAAGIDGFYGSGLDARLRADRRTDLIVCGYGLESTVHSTTRSANDRGYECLTVVDAALAHDGGLRHAARSSIEMSGGIFGAAAGTDDVLDGFDCVDRTNPLHVSTGGTR